MTAGLSMAAVSISKTLRKLHRGNWALQSLPKRYAPTPSSSSFSSSAPAISSSSPNSSSPSSSQSLEKPRGRWTRWLLFTPAAITFGLGTWQIFRRQEKIKMLEYRRLRLDMEPVQLNNLVPLSEKSDSLEFRRVVCKGVFDENKSIYVGPRSRSISGVTENGYYIITPLMPIPDDPESVQSPVLVNRGWVPRSWRDKSLDVSRDIVQPSNMKHSSVQESERHSWWRFWAKKPRDIEDQIHAAASVEVVGVVRSGEKPSIFVPANDPSSFQWFYVDVPAIAHACGLSESATYIEDINENINPSNPYPVPKDANTLVHSSVMPQDHLNYTLTWYSLSAAVTYMAFKRLMPKKSRR
ncbi:surfeit locus protein 1 [Malania oleifera]|uniref:surfeit locus protein 1 n=1 Tax=Malania oleifera TaxID=397392 RepID=UPI0025AE41C8|nr:surfeit locus protein 1 [Malania oleifera]